MSEIKSRLNHKFEMVHGGSRVCVDKNLLFTVTAVWIAGMFSALVCFGTFRRDVPELYMDYATRCSLGFAVAAPLIMLLCRVALGKLWSRAACIVTGALTALMFVGISVNMAGYLSVPGSTWQHPGLLPWSDSGVQYDAASTLFAGKSCPKYVSTGFARLICGFFTLFGQSLLPMLLFNAMCMSVAAALVGRICAALCPGGYSRRRAWVGALLFAVIPSVPYYGAMLMKEAPMTLGVALQALMLVEIWHGRCRLFPLAGAAAGTLLLIFVRHHAAYMMTFGALLCFIHAVSERSGTKGDRYNALLATLLLCFATVAAGRNMRADSDFILLDKNNATSNTESMMSHDTIKSYSTLIDNYYSKGLIDRVCLTPLTAAAQYFPPLPWNYDRDKALAAFVPVARLSVLWYIVGGLVLGYFVLCMPRKRAAGGLRLWAVFWLCCYLGVAVMSGGSVARYYLGFMPLCMPLAVRMLLSVKEKAVSRKSFYTYCATYTVLLAIGLTIAYHYQNYG